MPSTVEQRPIHWNRPSYAPLNTRPLTPSAGATYKVLFPSPMGNGRRVTASQNSTGMALFVTPWPDASRFETDVLGYSTYVSGQKYLNRRTPLRHGDPAQQSLYLDSLETISHHNFGKHWHEACTVTDGQYSKGWPKTEMIGYRGTFSQRPYLVREDSEVQSSAVPELRRFCTKHPETEAFHRKIPGFAYAFASNVDLKCHVLGSLPEFMVRWVYTLYQWPWDFNSTGLNSVPLDYIARTLGTVNGATFDTDIRLRLDNGSTTDGFPAETLRYEDFRMSQPFYGSNDRLFVDLQHIFLWNPRNWNKQANPTVTPTTAFASYEYVKKVNSLGSAFQSPDEFPYLQRDFNRLFFPAGAA